MIRIVFLAARIASEKAVLIQYELLLIPLFLTILSKQGRKRPLDTPKRMIERRERERKVEGEIIIENYYRKLLQEIMTGNFQQVYQ